MIQLPAAKTVSNTICVFTKQFEIDAPLYAMYSLCGYLLTY